MLTLIMHENYLKVYPELVAAALKSHEADLYAVWLVLKAIDKNSGSSGHIQHSYMLNFVMDILHLSITQSYKKLNDGQNKYWGKFAGKKGQKSTSLFSIERVINHLQPDLTRTDSFGLPVDVFYTLNGWKDIKAILYSIVASRYEDLRPVSRATICDNTGSSLSTLHRQIHSDKGPDIYRNEVVLAESVRADVVGKKREALFAAGHSSPLFIKKEGYMYHLIQVLPNSYSYKASIYNRYNANKHRPKALKYFDSINVANISSKKYYDNTEEKHDNKKGYVYTGDHSDKRTHPTRFWKQVGT